MSVDSRLAELGIVLPDAATPVANYVTAKRSGDQLFLAGHVSKRGGAVVTGQVGTVVSRDDAKALARATAIDMLASARVALGSLDRVRQVVKVVGFVNSAPDFADHAAVLNGASDLLVEVFGAERGRHARSSVGVASLPLGAALEIEAIFEVE